MAVPELGQIRIIPDYYNWQIAVGRTLTLSGQSITTGTMYDMFDHRPSNRAIWDTSGTTAGFRVEGTDSLTGKWMVIIDGHNLKTAEVLIGISGGGTMSPITGCTLHSSGHVSADNYVDVTADDTFFACECVSSSATSTYSLFTNDASYYPVDAEVGLLHFGLVYEMPTNATASLSYNTKFQNKVNTAFSGASYSTLYNTKPQRVLSASWEYINWSTGSSGIDDFTTMMNQCFGSHIPVALQLSQDGSITSDYFMFARITKWNQTQMSPNLWKISAEFTEFI